MNQCLKLKSPQGGLNGRMWVIVAKGREAALAQLRTWL